MAEVEALPCVIEFFRDMWYDWNMTERVDAAWREMQEEDAPEDWDCDPTDDIRDAIECEWWGELIDKLQMNDFAPQMDDFMQWNNEVVLLMSKPTSPDDKCWLAGYHGLVSIRDIIEDEVPDWYADV